jgi:hypothetical protein
MAAYRVLNMVAALFFATESCASLFSKFVGSLDAQAHTLHFKRGERKRKRSTQTSHGNPVSKAKRLMMLPPVAVCGRGRYWHGHAL